MVSEGLGLKSQIRLSSVDVAVILLAGYCLPSQGHSKRLGRSNQVVAQETKVWRTILSADVSLVGDVLLSLLCPNKHVSCYDHSS